MGNQQLPGAIYGRLYCSLAGGHRNQVRRRAARPSDLGHDHRAHHLSIDSAIGSIIGGGFSAVGSVASTAGSGISSAAKPMAKAAGVTPDVAQDQAQAYLQPANPDPATMTPQDAQKEVAKDLAVYARGGNDAQAAKERIIDIMAVQMKISRDDAAKRFDDTQAKLQQAKDQAVQTAKNAADESAAAASKTSFAAFAMLLLGSIAAALGGSLAVQRRMLVTQRVVE